MRKYGNFIKRKFCCMNFVWGLNRYFGIIKNFAKPTLKKQPFADNLTNRCFEKFCKIHRKIPASESLL